MICVEVNVPGMKLEAHGAPASPSAALADQVTQCPARLELMTGIPAAAKEVAPVPPAPVGTV